MSMRPIVHGNDWFVAKPVLEKSLEWQTGILVIMSLAAIGTLVYAIRQWRLTGHPHALLAVFGAALASFYEPVGDLFAHVTYHEVNQINLTTAMGFRTPLWVLPVYVVFFGMPMLVLDRLIDAGLSLRRWLTIFLLAVPGSWLFEVPLIQMGAVQYYGDNQPFALFHFPVWMAFTNAMTMMVTAAGYNRLKTVYRGAAAGLLIVCVPLLVIGANAASALPIASALNSGRALAFNNAMALLSMALAGFYVLAAGTIVAQPRRAPATS